MNEPVNLDHAEEYHGCPRTKSCITCRLIIELRAVRAQRDTAATALLGIGTGLCSLERCLEVARETCEEIGASIR